MRFGSIFTQRRGLFIGRYFDIDFYLHPLWFLIASWLSFELSTEYFPEVLPGRATGFYFLLGCSSALLFFLSILLHELGHSLVSQRCKIPVPSITLYLFGGLAEIAREPDDAKSELKIALAGPAVSVVLCILFKLLSIGSSIIGLFAISEMCGWLSWINLLMALFNMIPGYPLDGGRVLRALLWAKFRKLHRATYISSRIGIGFSWLLVIAGVIFLATKYALNGGVFIAMGFFLKSAAESGYDNAIQREILAGVRVRDIMTANPATIRDVTPLNLVVDDFFLSGHHVAYPVCDADGQFKGLLRLDFLKEAPRERWPYITAGDCVSENKGDELRIGPQEPAGRAMRLLLAPELSRLAVVDEGKLLGIVTRHDILHYIEMHTAFDA